MFLIWLLLELKPMTSGSWYNISYHWDALDHTAISHFPKVMDTENGNVKSQNQHPEQFDYKDPSFMAVVVKERWYFAFDCQSFSKSSPL